MISTVNKCQQLADSFKLLAALFYEPEADLWEQEELLKQFLRLMQQASPGAFPVAQKMCDAGEVIDEEQMKVDYAALFLGPFELRAAPYGSVYLERNKQIMGDSTMAVLRLYREAGLVLDVKDAPDHIAIELEFMHYLYSLEAGAVHEGDNEKAIDLAGLRTHFLHTSLMPWVHPFCQSIKKGTDNLFYIYLADCLQEFIAEIAALDEPVLQDYSLCPKENADQPSV